MSDWDDSRAAARLKALASVEVAEPPPLAAVRQVAVSRARRSAQLMAFAVALPLGAMAAVGGYALREDAHRHPLPKRGPFDSAALRSGGRGEGAERVIKAQEAEKPVEKPGSGPGPGSASGIGTSVGRGSASRTAVDAEVHVAPAIDVVAETVPAPSVARRMEHRAIETPEIPAVAGYAPAPAPAPSRTTLADESAALSAALAALRGKHDPRGALEQLAAYQQRFPAGALRHEAALASVEAHRALGHTTEALAALENLPRRPELDVLRAELNAELGHCDVARDTLRELSTSGALRERALFTDATCALALGAKDDAIAALKQLPDSARARALLEKLQP